jgi:putative nucleotidyltransferase with HDIG domain
MQANSMIDEFWVDYKALIRQIRRNLPTLPIIVSELTNILEKTDNSTQQVEDVMMSDQAIATRILRIANTTFYRGNREKVTDTNDAIGMLGFDKIKDVILTTSVFKIFAGKELAEQKFSLEGMWKHSIGVAAASRSIAQYLGKSWHETAYTCGLVHDIGKIARFKLDEDNNDNQFLRDSQLALDKNINFFQAELINQSPRHDYLGYLICNHWGLSGAVEGVVRWHHEPNPEKRQKVAVDSVVSDLIDLVIVANWIVHKLEFGFSGHDAAEAPSDALLERLQVYHLENVIEDVERELEVTEEFCAMLDNS